MADGFSLRIRICLLLLYTAPAWATDANGCETSVFYSGTTQYKCLNSHNLPSTFDVSLLPENITRLRIEGEKNRLNGNFTPLPFRKQLVEVEFYNFNLGEQDSRFRFGDLLGDNKHHVGHLELNSVKLVTLTGADFKGFNQLEKLYVRDLDVTEVGPSVFEELGVSLSGSPVPDFESKLKWVIMLGARQPDQRTRLDWAFLKPAAESVEVINFESMGLATDNLTCSSPFKLKSARIIRFTDNFLHKLPSHVFRTLNANLELEIYLEWGRFCPGHADCRCCDMAEFAEWMRSNGQMNAVKSIRCGEANDHGMTSSAVFLNKTGIFDDC